MRLPCVSRAFTDQSMQRLGAQSELNHDNDVCCYHTRHLQEHEYLKAAYKYVYIVIKLYSNYLLNYLLTTY